jgi:hypothetical protein
MRSCEECLAIAVEIEAYDPTCATRAVRQEYVDLAIGWRKVAALALFQSMALAPSPVRPARS